MSQTVLEKPHCSSPPQPSLSLINHHHHHDHHNNNISSSTSSTSSTDLNNSSKQQIATTKTTKTTKTKTRSTTKQKTNKKTPPIPLGENLFYDTMNTSNGDCYIVIHNKNNNTNNSQNNNMSRQEQETVQNLEKLAQSKTPLLHSKNSKTPTTENNNNSSKPPKTCKKHSVTHTTTTTTKRSPKSPPLLSSNTNTNSHTSNSGSSHTMSVVENSMNHMNTTNNTNSSNSNGNSNGNIITPIMIKQNEYPWLYPGERILYKVNHVAYIQSKHFLDDHFTYSTAPEWTTISSSSSSQNVQHQQNVQNSQQNVQQRLKRRVIHGVLLITNYQIRFVKEKFADDDSESEYSDFSDSDTDSESSAENSEEELPSNSSLISSPGSRSNNTNTNANTKNNRTRRRNTNSNNSNKSRPPVFSVGMCLTTILNIEEKLPSESSAFKNHFSNLNSMNNLTMLNHHHHHGVEDSNTTSTTNGGSGNTPTSTTNNGTTTSSPSITFDTSYFSATPLSIHQSSSSSSNHGSSSSPSLLLAPAVTKNGGGENIGGGLGENDDNVSKSMMRRKKRRVKQQRRQQQRQRHFALQQQQQQKRHCEEDCTGILRIYGKDIRSMKLAFFGTTNAKPRSTTTTTTTTSVNGSTSSSGGGGSVMPAVTSNGNLNGMMMSMVNTIGIGVSGGNSSNGNGGNGAAVAMNGTVPVVQDVDWNAQTTFREINALLTSMKTSKHLFAYQFGLHKHMVMFNNQGNNSQRLKSSTMNGVGSGATNEWSIVYDPVKDFMRQGLVNIQDDDAYYVGGGGGGQMTSTSKNSYWRLSKVNVNYTLCDTYPKYLVVPRNITDDQLKSCAMFRSKGRIPALTWVHPAMMQQQNSSSGNNGNGNSGGGGCIARCSQPMVGVMRSRSREDEELIDAIRMNTGAQRVHIIDCRPKANAWAQTVMGRGYEDVNNYTNCTLEFMGIDNIHAMHSSLHTLTKLCQKSGDPYWLSSLENTGWLRHCRLILQCTQRIVELVEHKKMAVLIHCSDGWDRTSQVSALSQLLLDPYYRTIRGFELLIEKEWCSFGHKFLDRLGHTRNPQLSDEVSPVFLQFIDCVYQIMRQFPDHFEFDERFLITILDHIYSCLFGNFIHNCDKDRENDALRTSTVSLWTFINSNRQQFVNRLYNRKQAQASRTVLIPDSDIDTLSAHFWVGYFYRYRMGKKAKYQFMVDQALYKYQAENAQIRRRLMHEQQKRETVEKELQAYKRRLERIKMLDGQDDATIFDSVDDDSEDGGVSHSTLILNSHGEDEGSDQEEETVLMKPPEFLSNYFN